MKRIKRVGALIMALVMVFSMLPATVFAINESNFSIKASSVDGSVGGTVTVTFVADQDIEVTAVDGLLPGYAGDPTFGIQIASVANADGVPDSATYTGIVSDGEGNQFGYINYVTAAPPLSLSAGDPIFTATYTVPAGTPAGKYPVTFTIEDSSCIVVGDVTIDNTVFTGYIEVTEPPKVLAYELYYELNSDKDDDDGDKYTDFVAGDTVTATIYAKAATPTKLQAFDLYVTNDELLEFQSYESSYGTRIGSSAGEGQASTPTFQHIQFKFEQGSKVEIDIDENGTELATINFVIADDAVYSNDAIEEGWLPITITEDSNLATQNNEQSINTTRGENDPYLLTISAPVLGAEVVSTYTVTYDDNVDDNSVTNMPEPISQTKYHNRPLTLSATEPVRTGYTFKGWSKTAGKVYTNDEDIDYAAGAEFTENADTPLYALWQQNTYTVNWYNNHADTALLETDTSVIHGSAPQYDGEEPTKEPVGSKVYTFVGWSEDQAATTGTALENLPVVTKDTDYYAIFSESDRMITVHWMSQDGTAELSTSSILYGQKPEYQNGFSEPTKAEDGGCTYVFAGWATEANQTSGTALNDLASVTDEVYYFAAFVAQPKTFAVTLATNGGTIADEFNITEYTYGDVVTLPDASKITLPGFTFDGWYTDKDFAEGSGPVTEITGTDFGDKVFYAKWTEITYNVKYEPGDGDGNEHTDPDIGYDESYTIKAPAELGFTAPAGYVFAGWQASNGKTYNTGSSYTKMTETAGETITLTALWSQDVFNITYVFTEGTNALTDVTNDNPDTYNKTTGLTLNNPSKNGYSFVKWTAVMGDTEFVLTDGNTIPANTEGDLVITGTFTLENYKITYEANGGNVDPATQDYNITSTEPLAVPTRDGYTFAGWKNTGAAVGSWDANETTNPGGQNLNKDWGNVTLTAQWTQKEYTITFTGMAEANVTATYKIEDNATIASKQSNPSKPHYTFNGWIPNDGGNGNWGTDMIAAADTGTTTVNGKFGNVTLTAQWTAIEYTITFYSKPENSADNTVLETITFTAESAAITPPAVPSLNGYAGTWSEYSQNPAAGNQNVYPEYTAIEYDIKYNANGGYVTPEIQKYTVNSKDALAVPTREGYTFEGWVVTSESTGSWVNGVNKGTNYKLNLDYGSVELQAQWKANSYTITFVTEGNPIAQMTYSSSDTTALPTSTGNGLYIFKHWRLTAAEGAHNWGEVKNDTTGAAGAIFTAGYSVNSHYGNITLTAEWDLSFTYVVEEYKFAYTGWKMLRIDATELEAGTIYTFDGKPMYYTTDTNYLIDPDADTGVFFTLVPATYVDDLALNKAGEGKVNTSTEVEAAALYAENELIGDINGDGKVNIADANIVHQMVERGGGYYAEGQLSVLARLRCDMDTETSGTSGEFRGSINDTNAIINLINLVQN